MDLQHTQSQSLPVDRANDPEGSHRSSRQLPPVSAACPGNSTQGHCRVERHSVCRRRRVSPRNAFNVDRQRPPRFRHLPSIPAIGCHERGDVKVLIVLPVWFVLKDLAVGLSIGDVDSSLSKNLFGPDRVLFGFLAFPYRFVGEDCPLFMMGIGMDAE